jgi:hypothetical protein
MRRGDFTVGADPDASGRWICEICVSDAEERHTNTQSVDDYVMPGMALVETQSPFAELYRITRVRLTSRGDEPQGVDIRRDDDGTVRVTIRRAGCASAPRWLDLDAVRVLVDDADVVWEVVLDGYAVAPDTWRWTPELLAAAETRRRRRRADACVYALDDVGADVRALRDGATSEGKLAAVRRRLALTRRVLLGDDLAVLAEFHGDAVRDARAALDSLTPAEAEGLVRGERVPNFHIRRRSWRLLFEHVPGGGAVGDACC